MMIVVYILGSIIALVLLFLILALFSKKAYSVKRNVLINKPKEQVFDYLKYIKNQDNYNVWTMMDPQMKKDYRGTDGTVGFVYAWEGNKKAGAGEQEIKGISEGQRLNLEVRFIRPFPGVAQAPFTTESQGDQQTLVTWSIQSEMKFPMNALMLFMSMDKMLGKDMENSLGRLKGILEKR